MNILSSSKTDPRIIRTKHLLVDAFLKVSKEKDLTEITVKNITDIATVNRATFYSHFNDKYEILDYTLSVTILKDLNDTLSISKTINSNVLSQLFVAISNYMLDVKQSCERNKEAFCNQAHYRIKHELEDILGIMLENTYPEHPRHSIVASATFLSSGICGLAKHWLDNSQASPDEFIESHLSYLTHHISNL